MPDLGNKKEFYRRLDLIEKELREEDELEKDVANDPPQSQMPDGKSRVGSRQLEQAREQPEVPSTRSEMSDPRPLLEDDSRATKRPNRGLATSTVELPSASRSTSTRGKTPTTRGRGRGNSRRAPKVGGKRKREAELPMMPEERHIFKGQRFFYYPNNDISAARRFHMAKARQFGGHRVENWAPQTITHVVVDSDVEHSAVIQGLNIDGIPRDIAVVKDNYPPDCIQYRTLEVRSRHRVKGHQQALDTIDAIAKARILTSPPSSTQSTTTSLPLKPDRRIHASSYDAEALEAENARGPSLTLARKQALGPITVNYDAPPRRKRKATPTQELEGRVTSSISEIMGTSQRNSGPKDELDNAIEELKTIEGLPLDPDDDGLTEDDAEERSAHQTKRPRTADASVNPAWQKNFACMRRHSSDDGVHNPNARTIEILQKMADHYERMKDQWRPIAYRRAITALKKEAVKVSTKEQALKIAGVGARLAEKIEEIVQTNRLRCLDNTELDPNDVALQQFMQVYGCGLAQAQAWLAQGYRTLEELRKNPSLTKNQHIGLEHYDDFLARIPRAEVEEHVMLVQKVLADISPDLQAVVGGSFRRGALSCGDVDLLITSSELPDHALRSLVFEDVVPRLFKMGYLKASLASRAHGDDGSKWHGAAALPEAPSQVWRRVDFLIVPWQEWGAALIYFTGNDLFNRSLRLLASKKGMRLNQRGLYRDVMRGPQRARVTNGTLVEGRSEEKIFEILGVPWRPPEHRIC